jgi:hypothetical protein
VVDLGFEGRSEDSRGQLKRIPRTVERGGALEVGPLLGIR